MYKSPYDPDKVKYLLDRISEMTDDCWCDRMPRRGIDQCRGCRERQYIRDDAKELRDNSNYAVALNDQGLKGPYDHALPQS